MWRRSFEGYNLSYILRCFRKEVLHIAAPYIFCKGSDTHDNTQDFYLIIGQDRYFLFKQPYRKGVQEYFGNGVSIDKAIKHSWNKLDRAVLRTIDKIPQYIRYIEKEYNVAVLDQTRKEIGKDAKRKRFALDQYETGY